MLRTSPPMVCKYDIKGSLLSQSHWEESSAQTIAGARSYTRTIE